MPLYEYACDACGQRFELIQKFSDPTPETCAKCGKGPVHRQLSSPAIQFKGSGWYITDYAQKGKSDSGKTQAAKSEGGNDAKTESKSESNTETKAETKAATKTETKP
jgi:putative FmdB family regulatory protein